MGRRLEVRKRVRGNVPVGEGLEDDAPRGISGGGNTENVF